MASKEAAQTALKNHSVYNVFLVPLMVAPVEESVESPAFATPTSEPRASNIDGTRFSDMEASVFRKLQARLPLQEVAEFFRKSIASGSASTSAHEDNTPDNGTKTDKGKVLKVSWEGGADYYTTAKLDEVFRQFGEVEDIVIKTRKSKSKGSAIVVMASKEVAQTALKNHFVYNVFPGPLMVAPIEESGESPASAAPTPEPNASNIDGIGFSDMEASVFRKLQEAQKRK